MGTFLEDYYNKFNEEKRLTSRHGQIEFRTSIHYIHECIEELKKEGRENIKVPEQADTALHWLRKALM